MSRALPIDAALYLRADQFVTTLADPPSGGTTTSDRWPVYGADMWALHAELMLLLYSGVLWDLARNGRIRLATRTDGTVTATMVELGADEQERLRSQRRAGELPVSSSGELMQGFALRARKESGATITSAVSVSELVGWGQIHGVSARRRFRLPLHDELEHRGALQPPPDFDPGGLKGAWKRFRRRAATGDRVVKPRADELVVDPSALAGMTGEIDEVIAAYRYWDEDQPDLARAVGAACVEGYAARSPFKGYTDPSPGI